MGAILACRRSTPVSPTSIEGRSDAVARGGRDRHVEEDARSAPVLEHWGAALSHRSAAQLWGLLSARSGDIDISVPGHGGKKKRRRIRVHRSTSLTPASVTLRCGIPVTKPGRTIADLRLACARAKPLVSTKELRRATRQADVLRLPLGEEVESDGTRSDLELDFLAICRRHRLPVPEVNAHVGRHLVDFLWRDRALVVETDSYDYHRGRTAFQDDRGRDLDLRGRGFDVIRVAEKQVNEEPRQVAEVVGAALRVGADAA